MSFNNLQIQRVWNNATIVNGVDSQIWRKDTCGAWIYRYAYGDRQSDYGWEIDHIIPQSKGGSDDFGNLRALHWGNNASRQNGILTCVILSRGKENVKFIPL